MMYKICIVAMHHHRQNTRGTKLQKVKFQTLKFQTIDPLWSLTFLHQVSETPEISPNPEISDKFQLVLKFQAKFKKFHAVGLKFQSLEISGIAEISAGNHSMN